MQSTYSVCQFVGSFYFSVLESSWRQRRDLRAARGSSVEAPQEEEATTEEE